MEEKTTLKSKSTNTTSAIYMMGMIGAAIYYLGQATGFWMGVLGCLKALVWPVILVYEALGHYGA